MRITWVIIWFCITPTNNECKSLDGRESVGNFSYHTEESCVTGAEWRADLYWNEKNFRLEYDCIRKTQPWDFYVPVRRKGGVPK